MSDVEVYRDGLVHVRAEQCDRCLFSKDRLVPGSRARALIASARETPGGSFVCHRAHVSDEGQAICCKFWDEYAMEDGILRLAIHQGIVVFDSTTPDPPGSGSPEKKEAQP